MDKWEYMVIEARADYLTLKPWYINDVEVEKWKTWPSICDYLNYLGEEGWELISVADHVFHWEVISGTPPGRMYYLKRWKSEPSEAEKSAPT